MIVDHDKLKSLLTLKFSNLPDKRVELVEFSSTIRWNLGTQERLISQSYKDELLAIKFRILLFQIRLSQIWPKHLVSYLFQHS